MYSKVEFRHDFITAYGYLGTASYKRGKLADVAERYIEYCFQVYTNSANNSLGSLVVGRIVKRDGNAGPTNLAEIGRGLDDIERANFGVTNAGSAGSVLKDDEWEMPLNDAWLLGGIHAHLDFYVASPRTRANIVNAEFGASVTGRELLGLTTFGYSLHANRRLGEVFTCTDRARARAASFPAYVEAFNKAKASNGFEALVDADAR